MFKKGNIVNVNHQGKTQPYQLQKDQNYARNNMKLYCDPNYGYDSYINIGDYHQEVNLAYVPKPAFVVAQQQPKPAPPAPHKNQAHPKIPIHSNPVQAKNNPSQLPQVNQPTKNNHNPAQYIDKAKNGKP